MMSNSKVHIYVKPKQGVKPVAGGVIRTSARGEIIAPKKKKEEKEMDVDELKEIVSKVMDGETEKKSANPEAFAQENTFVAQVEEKKESSAQSLEENAELGSDETKPAEEKTTEVEAQKSASQEEKSLEREEKNIHATMSLGGDLNEMHQLQSDFGAVLTEFDTSVKVEMNKPKPVEPQITLDPYLRQNEPVRVLEAALFMAGQGLDNMSLGKVVGVNSISGVQKMMAELSEQYKQINSSIEITQDTDKKWYMRVKSNYAPAVKQFAGEAEISKHALRTLAYISKNNGVTKRNLFKRIGGSIYEDVAELEEKGFVETVPLGRTKKVFLTVKFKQYFGI